MKTKFLPILTAICMIAIGFASAPAKATPTLSLTFDGTYFAILDGEATFTLANDELTLGLTMDQAAALDAVDDGTMEFDLFSTFLVVNYEITVDDPSPSTPRNWVLDFDFSFMGALLGETESDVTLFDTTILDTAFGITFPTPTFPLSDFVGPFPLLAVAEIGLLIDYLLSEACSPASPISIGGGDVGACLYAPDMDLLSGLIAVGLSAEATDYLLFDLLYLDSVLPPDTEAIDIEFMGELKLTAVPEPGTLAIFGLGLVGLGVARRRKAA